MDDETKACREAQRRLGVVWREVLVFSFFFGLISWDLGCGIGGKDGQPGAEYFTEITFFNQHLAGRKRLLCDESQIVRARPEARARAARCASRETNLGFAENRYSSGDRDAEVGASWACAGRQFNNLMRGQEKQAVPIFQH